VQHENINARLNDMQTRTPQSSVKVIGTNGQVSLGKQYAGRQVLVEEREPGVWLIRTATVIPDNERWLHEPGAAADLVRAVAWAERHPPAETDPDALLERPRPKRARRSK
jgi:putative transposon-encoded protein